MIFGYKLYIQNTNTVMMYYLLLISIDPKLICGRGSWSVGISYCQIWPGEWVMVEQWNFGKITES